MIFINPWAFYHSDDIPDLNPQDNETYVDATCEQANGIIKECTICGLIEYIPYTEDSPFYSAPMGHSETILKAVPATCSQTGLTQGSICKICKKVLVKQAI